MQRSVCILLVSILANAGCISLSPGGEDVAPGSLAPLPPGIDAALAAALTTPGVRAFDVTVQGEPARGFIGVPASGTSDRLLVVAHGLGDDIAWVPEYFEWVTAELGVIGVAMTYRGELGAFNVRAGIDDTIAATLAVQALHPSVLTTVLYGVSMGGEVSGVAVAEAPPGTYDVWIDGVGVTDLARFWLEAPWARSIIEAETGGTPDDVPQEYRSRSPLDQVGAIAAHGLTRAYLVYGAADAIVPLDHAERMYDALVGLDVPVTYHLVTSGPDAWVCVPPVFDACPTLPVGPAGHEAGWTGIVIQILDARLAGQPDPDGPRARYLHEGVTGTRVPR